MTKALETLQLDANGCDMHALAMGDGPLVLCLHGFPDTAHSFAAQMPALANAGYRIVAPFMRGYAPTQRPADDTSPVDSAMLGEDVLAWLDALSPETPAVVIGHDWGASAAYAAALSAPHRLSHLITLAVPFGPGLGQALISNPSQQRRSWYMFFFQMPFAEAAVAHDDFRLLEQLWQDWSPGWAYSLEELEQLKQCFRQPGVASAALSYYRAAFGRRRSERDKPTPSNSRQARRTVIEVPTLYLHGANDGCIGSEVCTGQERHFSGTFHQETIADAGHFLHREVPDLINQRILSFLSS
jgi:pimeloyl-ACP methyl ester carboxylesterase